MQASDVVCVLYRIGRYVIVVTWAPVVPWYMYTQNLRATGPRAEGIHIRQTTSARYNCHVPWSLLLASIKQLIKNNWIPQLKATTLTRRIKLSYLNAKLNPTSKNFFYYKQAEQLDFVRKLISGILA